MNKNNSVDLKHMSRAIELANYGRFSTSPNPNVGCVIVKNGTIIGEGWHQKAGTGHAEVNALSSLTLEQTAGATAYVTLEPCSHFGRTPPCAEALVKAQFKRVVVAMLDPNPLVAGKGIKILEDANIKTTVGLLVSEARELNRGFLKQMEEKQPFVQLKLACSLDGKTALSNGESKWITGPESRSDVQTYRAQSCAIISSALSVVKDNAKLNVREEQLNFDYPFSEFVTEIRQPAKIILDGANRITPTAAKDLALFNAPSTPIILVKSASSESLDKVQFSDFSQVKVVHLDYTNGEFDLSELLSLCHDWQFNRVWVETGAKLSAAFVNQGLVDELVIYMAPKLMGKGANDLLPIGPFNKMDQIKELKLKEQTQVGNDLKMIFSLI